MLSFLMSEELSWPLSFDPVRLVNVRVNSFTAIWCKNRHFALNVTQNSVCLKLNVCTKNTNPSGFKFLTKSEVYFERRNTCSRKQRCHCLSTLIWCYKISAESNFCFSGVLCKYHLLIFVHLKENHFKRFE